MSKKGWYWPTEEGWFFVVFLAVLGWAAGGWVGAAVMVAFVAMANVLGN
jgi:hypothetical protein